MFQGHWKIKILPTFAICCKKATLSEIKEVDQELRRMLVESAEKSNVLSTICTVSRNKTMPRHGMSSNKPGTAKVGAISKAKKTKGLQSVNNLLQYQKKTNKMNRIGSQGPAPASARPWRAKRGNF